MEGRVIGNKRVGGVIGSSSGQITISSLLFTEIFSLSDVVVICSIEKCGGLFGVAVFLNSVSISNSYSRSNVSGNASIVGEFIGSISFSYQSSLKINNRYISKKVEGSSETTSSKGKIKSQ